MLTIFLATAFLVLVHVSPSTISDPTSDEISRAEVVPPTSFWSWRMRKEGNIRAVAIGGSNTESKPDEAHFCELLNTVLKKEISQESYVLNQGKQIIWVIVREGFMIYLYSAQALEPLSLGSFMAQCLHLKTGKIQNGPIW